MCVLQIVPSLGNNAFCIVLVIFQADLASRPAYLLRYSVENPLRTGGKLAANRGSIAQTDAVAFLPHRIAKRVQITRDPGTPIATPRLLRGWPQLSHFHHHRVPVCTDIST